VASAGPPLGGAFGGVSPFSANLTFGAPFQRPPLGGLGMVPNIAINPAVLQGILQLRNAGLI
jgi:hypothetical protein